MITRRLLGLIAAACLALAPSAQAALIEFSVNPAPLTVTAGDTVTFSGVITNLSASVLGAADFFFAFSSYDPLALSPTQLLGSTDFTLPSFTFSPTVDLFSITIAPDAIAASYSFDVLLLDIDNNLSDLFSTSLTVLAAPATNVPEPGTLPLMFAGLAAAFAASTRLRRGASS